MKLGFILDSEHLPPDLEALLKASHDSRHFSVDLIVTYSDLLDGNKNILQKLVSRFRDIGLIKMLQALAFNLIQRFEGRMSGKTSNGSSVQNIISSGVPILRIKPIFSKSKFVVRIDDRDQDMIRAKNIDMLVRGGRHILRGGILDLCPFGVLGIHHGDNKYFRGIPSGFWEVYYGKPFTGYIFQRLRDELDDGLVFYKGKFPTKSAAFANTHYLHQKARLDYVEFIEEVSRSKTFPKCIERKGELGPLRSMPSLKQLLNYLKNIYLV
jgi:hypothetical protein